MNYNARAGTKRHLFITAAYFLFVVAATFVILYARSSGASELNTREEVCQPAPEKECICQACVNETIVITQPAPVPDYTKKNEEIARLNKTATDFKSQIDFIREHYFPQRRKQIEERERLRTESGYYTKTKKLAICFSGFLRNVSLTEDRIRNELFSLFGEDTVDIFLFTPKVVVNGTEEPLPSLSWNVTELRTYKQQDLREPKAGQLYHYRTNFQGWLQQYYGIAGCYNVIREYQERTKTKYEWVARARPDVVYFYPNTTFKASFSLQGLDSNVWWIPDNQHWDGSNDKFMLSSNINYELYADFDNVYYYTGLFKPEIYHKKMVEMYGIKIKSIKNFTTKIVREDGSYGPW